MGGARIFVAFVLVCACLASPAASQVSAWDEQTQGPLPRWREGGTPEPDPRRPLTPEAIARPKATAVPTACPIDAPPEYSPTDGVLLRFSAGAWPQVVTDIVAALTADPAHDEIAYVVVASNSVKNLATDWFTDAGADLSKVEFIIKPTDSIWMRDYGPHFIWQNGAQAIVDSHYYPTRPLDNFVPTLLGDSPFRQHVFPIGMYYSGGNLQPGPNRSGFVTSLIHTDNPGFGEPFLGELYSDYQGIDTLHVLPQLPGSVDGTGHIDMWFYLVDEDTVIISEFLPGSNQEAIDITNNAVPYMQALGFDVVRVPAWNAGAIHYTYANAFRVNDRIFVPTYGQGDSDYLDEDATALAAWQAAAGPGVEIVGINSYTIIPAAGAIHCIVMQVPRHVDTIPSTCVNSPEGGEVLVAGASHEVEWSGSDDDGIDGYDIYYTTDGSSFEPIALNQSGNRISYGWNIPLFEAPSAQVKVVATDDDANTGEALSSTDFTVTTAARRVYDFNQEASVDRWAWGFQTQNWDALDGVRKPPSVNSELQSVSYAALATSNATGGDTDGQRYQSPPPTPGAESTHVFEFSLDENPATIVDIEVAWEGYGDDCLQMELYVWNYDLGQWCDGRGQCGENRFVDNFAGNRDKTLRGHITEEIDAFISFSGRMSLLVYAERPNQQSFHDYVSITVTHEPCLGPDTDFDGYADACDTCPLDYGANQVDTDSDGYGNICDCAPTNVNIHEIPFEIANLVAPSRTTFSWSPDTSNSGSGTSYEVLRGDTSTITGGYAGDCLVPAAGVELEDTDVPPLDEGFYYLVRGANVCDAGVFGYDSSGTERLSSACP